MLVFRQKKEGRSTIKGRIRPCFEANQGKASRSSNPDRLVNCNHLKQIQLQNAGSRPGSPGSWVDRVLSGRCTCRSFNEPEPVQPPGRLGRPGPRSTRRAGPGLISVIQHHLQNIEKTQTFDFIYPFFTNLRNILSP